MAEKEEIKMNIIYLDGIIGEDIKLSSFNLNDDLICYLNSHGGSLSEAREIYNAVKNCSHKTTVIINPTVASAASYICMAFDEIKAYKNSAMMIHRSRAMLDDATANDLDVYNELLTSMDNIMADVFANKMNKSKEEVLHLMDNDAWIIGEKLKFYGIVDEFIDDEFKDNFFKPDIYTIAKNKIKKLKRTYASNYKTDLDLLAAKLDIKPQLKNEIEENINFNKEDKNMTLQEFLSENPDAQAEFETLIASEVAKEVSDAVRAERERIANLILSSEDTVIEDEVIEAINKGIKFDTFAKMKFARGREKQKTIAFENAFIPTKVNPYTGITAVIDEDALRKAVRSSTKKFGLRGKK